MKYISIYKYHFFKFKLWRLYPLLVFNFLLLTFNLSVSAQVKKIKLSSKNLEFVENKHQWADNILYKADIPYGAVFVEKNCLTFNFVNPADVSYSHAHNHSLGNKYPDIIHFNSYKVHFLNSNNEQAKSNRHQATKSSNPQSTEHRERTTVYGIYPTADYCNYFLNNDPGKWAAKVSKYQSVSYDNIYNKIDLIVTSRGKSLKYNFIVHPGGNIDDIALQYEGLKKIKLKKNNLTLESSLTMLPNLFLRLIFKILLTEPLQAVTLSSKIILLSFLLIIMIKQKT